MDNNSLRQLRRLGQSAWIDFIQRRFVSDGELGRLVREDDVSGLTSDPAIFDRAVTETTDYDEIIRTLGREHNSALDIYRLLSIHDIQEAADILAPVYRDTHGFDGYVSLEVSPRLARNPEGTLQEARQLWREVDRPNLMIKVPATREDLPAIRALIEEGINVNVTLLFSLERYGEVADAYLSGLEARLGRGEPISAVASVASFFLSRIDLLVDRRLEEKMQNPELRERAAALRGEVAIACAKQAYLAYWGMVRGKRFRALSHHGAKPQCLLWASTGTKNPVYSEVKYVETLIGPDTINTMRPETLAAFRDYGQPAPRLTESVDRAGWVLAELAAIGIDLGAIASELEVEGIEKFNQSFDKLLASIEAKL